MPHGVKGSGTAIPARPKSLEFSCDLVEQRLVGRAADMGKGYFILEKWIAATCHHVSRTLHTMFAARQGSDVQSHTIDRSLSIVRIGEAFTRKTGSARRKLFKNELPLPDHATLVAISGEDLYGRGSNFGLGVALDEN